jgi:hypothetical protein
MPAVTVRSFGAAALAALSACLRAFRAVRLRRAARGGQAPVLRLSSQALTPQASVHAVQWRGDEYLLGCTAHRVTLLCRRAIPGEAEERR